jgi:hypothetical protein
MTGTSPVSQQIAGLALCNDSSGVEVLLAAHPSSSSMHQIDPETMEIMASSAVSSLGAMVCACVV